MKKYLLFALMLCCICLTAGAYTMYGSFSCNENGETVARIELSQNGNCTIADYETGDRWSGTYEISWQPTPGDSNIPITFYINGSQYHGKMYWPTQGRMAISFDGRYFELSRR